MFPRYASGGTAIVGYNVQNTLAVTLQGTGRAGELIDALVGAGANQVQNVAFSVADQTEFLDAALGLAVEDARRRAGVLADAANLDLGVPLTIDTIGTGILPTPTDVQFSTAPGTVPIEVGPYEISTRVVVIFSTQQR